jgi:hypothetical protein
VALLGSLLAAGYRTRLDTTGLPEPVADAARTSITAAVAMAERTGNTTLASSGQAAFVHGMALALAAAAAVALLGAILTAILLPGRPGNRRAERSSATQPAPTP